MKKIIPVMLSTGGPIATVIDISEVRTTLDTSANFVSTIYSSSGENNDVLTALQSQSVTIVGEAYAIWGIDDSYIYQVAAKKMGVILA
jgi:hypothetical protein